MRVALACTFALLAAPLAAALVPFWNQLGQNAQHTSYSKVAGPVSSRVGWSLSIGVGTFGEQDASPAITQVCPRE